jgi:hypothetical protein
MSMDQQEKERRCVLFKAIRADLGLSQGDLAKWFYGQDTKLTRKYISRKETLKNPVSITEICFLRSLQALKAKSVDLKSVVFNSELEIIALQN